MCRVYNCEASTTVQSCPHREVVSHRDDNWVRRKVKVRRWISARDELFERLNDGVFELDRMIVCRSRCKSSIDNGYAAWRHVRVILR